MSRGCHRRLCLSDRIGGAPTTGCHGRQDSRKLFSRPMLRTFCTLVALAVLGAVAPPAFTQGDNEITPVSEAALEKGLVWLAKNQGPEGNWGSNDLGLVSMGA